MRWREFAGEATVDFEPLLNVRLKHVEDGRRT